MEYYRINLAGIERDLPIVPISDKSQSPLL